MSQTRLDPDFETYFEQYQDADGFGVFDHFIELYQDQIADVEIACSSTGHLPTPQALNRFWFSRFRSSAAVFSVEVRVIHRSPYMYLIP